MDPSPAPAPSFDAYAPAEVARRVRDVGVTKANLDVPSMLALAVLAGAFISLGAALSTLAQAGSGLGYGPGRLLAGFAFSLGLILVVVAGAELFTGNNLVIMAWASGKVSTARLLRSWALVYLGNFVGAVVTAVLLFHTRRWGADDPVGVVALRIAVTKAGLASSRAFVSGVFCNALVCLAVWLCFSARSTTDKILSIIPPITAFVALGFEHSVANMYFIPLGLLLRSQEALVQAAGIAPESLSALTWAGLWGNLLPVTLGNLIGGGLMVAGIYWFIYLRKA